MVVGRFEILEQCRSVFEITSTAKFFQFLREFDNAFGSEVQAHAFERVGMEAKFGRIGKGLADLRNS